MCLFRKSQRRTNSMSLLGYGRNKETSVWLTTDGEENTVQTWIHQDSWTYVSPHLTSHRMLLEWTSRSDLTSPQCREQITSGCSNALSKPRRKLKEEEEEIVTIETGSVPWRVRKANYPRCFMHSNISLGFSQCSDMKNDVDAIWELSEYILLLTQRTSVE